MDIISYGAAAKAASSEKRTREGILAEGVQGSFQHVKERIDAMSESIAKVTDQADKMVIQDAVNIMKAHAKLNAIAKTKKYNMHQMVFDDLLDLSGIDTTKSSGYIYDEVEGSLTADEDFLIETKEEAADIIPKKVILSVSEETHHEQYSVSDILGEYFISRDNGATWELIEPNTLFYFSDSISPLENKLRIKAELPGGTKLLNYALTWA